MHRKRDLSRDSLRFVDATRESFRFLGQFGFRELGAEDTVVRYANDQIYLNVYHGRSSYELGVEVGRVGTERDAHGHSISALIRATNAVQASSFRNPVATTEEDVKTGLVRLAQLVRTFGAPVLNCDSQFFDLLDIQQRQWAEDYAAEIAYDQTLPRAEEAFRQRDYRAAVKLYESIRNSLAPSDLKKLEYARKHK